ncbi:MAG TPA: outer membrane lipoprotein chaperone LolA [Steroidobacteraceae bacterium]|nr:outer membrane lipoprotein chaperone LolA [Steroidobacteraceae bacterium]
MSRFSLLSLALVFLAGHGAHAATSATALDTYLADVKTLRTQFHQVVTDSDGRVVQQATGSLLIKRPGRFRWELTPDGSDSSQLMVADGRNLWFYDRDLEQVSVKSAATALTATPASLLSGDGKITEFFDVSADGKRDDLDWVRVVPRRTDADFREARLGFRGAGTELRRMVLRDKLGQTVTLDFSTSERNANVTDAEVSFTPPPGADVIGTAAK